MDIPGMSPIPQGPIQRSPGGVPDLILNVPPRPQAPAQPQPQAPAVMPHQAPAQAVIQHSTQNIMNALLEMHMAPTPQNQQIAQSLANYGHPVNKQTMQLVQQALGKLSDKSGAAIEAAIVLLMKDLPVTDRNVAALKQLMNGQPLPQQLQNLPKDLGPLVQQLQTPAMQQTATQTPVPAQAQPTAPNPGMNAPVPGTGLLPGSPNAPAVPSQPGTPAALPGQAAPATALPPGQTAPTVIALPGATPQAVAQSSAVQQMAGQAQVVENRGDTSKTSGQDSAQQINALQSTNRSQSVQAPQGQTAQAQPQNTATPQATAPAAQHNPGQAIEAQGLQLHLAGKDMAAIEKIGPGGPQAALISEDQYQQLLKLLENIQQVASRLGDSMALKQFQQLPAQHQQIIQLTGLLETRTEEFWVLFSKTFPGLARKVQGLLQDDGLDLFTKLAHLIEGSQGELTADLQHLGDSEKAKLLTALLQLLEQTGFQVEKVHANLVGRELLTQNAPIHCIPLTIHANQEQYSAEMFIEHDQDSPYRSPDGQVPMKITLTLETKNLGRVAIDLSALKNDMNVDLQVLNRRVQQIIQERLDQLKYKLEQHTWDVQQIHCRINPELETRQTMLLPQKRVVRSLQRIEGVV